MSELRHSSANRGAHTGEVSQNLLKHLASSVLIVVALLLFACSSGENEESASSSDNHFARSAIATEHYASVTASIAAPDISDPDFDTFVESLNRFAFTAYRALATTAPDSNGIIGNYSLASALSLLRGAATGATDTSIAQLLQVDGLDEATVHAGMNRLSQALSSRANDDLTLRVANRLLTRQGVTFGDAFMDIAAGHYDAPATSLDFATHNAEALALINDWVSDTTNGLIPSLLESLSPDTLVVLLNAVLLDATWQESMSDRGTLDFRTGDGSVREVPSFGYTGTARWHRAEDGSTAVELDYAGGEIAMLLIQPADLETFEANVSAAAITDLRAALRSGQAIVQLPEWRTETTLPDPAALLGPYGFPQNPVQLNDLLAAPVADISLDTVHKAVIEVDKDGTRAAAATGIIGVTSAPLIEDTLVFDRPFAYMLIDRPTGAILFTGRLLDPLDG